MARFVSRGPRETQRIAKNILRRFAASPTRPLIFALAGELGSGKTTFIQGLARALGIREKVQSPTFVLMRSYDLDSSGSRPTKTLRSRKESPRLRSENRFLRFVHVDAYRIERLAEARHLGLRDVFKDREAIVVIEWADRIRAITPRNAIWIQFKHGRNPQERVIELVKRVKQVKRVK